MKSLSLSRCALSVCVALLLSIAIAGCRSASTGSPQVVPFAKAPGFQSRAERLGRPIDKIKHMVIIVQMDRSLNNLFMGFPGAKDGDIWLRLKKPEDRSEAGVACGEMGPGA